MADLFAASGGAFRRLSEFSEGCRVYPGDPEPDEIQAVLDFLR